MRKTLAVVALIVLIGFLAILLWRVPRLDLGAIIVVTAGMAAYDFLFYRQKRNGS